MKMTSLPTLLLALLGVITLATAAEGAESVPALAMATDAKGTDIKATETLADASRVQDDAPVYEGFPGRFDPERDLFLPQFDSKTDVDDLHSVAGVATLLRDPRFSGVRFQAVAGAYGMQEGLYVPAPELFQAAFGDRWSDAHSDWEVAVEAVAALARETLDAGGSVWVAEAGQSDFTADWLERLHAEGRDTARVHVVQHSDWNQEVTTPEKLARVRALATYHRIADGNVAGNGTPGFLTPDPSAWPRALSHPTAGDTWRLARDLANRYNGVEARYLNEAIQAGGIDFSDVSETCWIFGFEQLLGVDAFFETFGSDAGSGSRERGISLN